MKKRWKVTVSGIFFDGERYFSSMIIAKLFAVLFKIGTYYYVSVERCDT